MKRLLLLFAGLILAGSLHAQGWGEVRYVHAATNVRAEHSATSAVVAKLQVGDWVHVDFCEES